MSFLDSLENSLKALESREERDPAESSRREHERQRSLAAAPWADQLKNSEYTNALLEKSSVAGRRIRAKVYMAWVGTTLRLEVRGRILELLPVADGIVARYTTASGEQVEQPVDLKSDPEALLNQWLEGEKLPVPQTISDELKGDA